MRIRVKSGVWNAGKLLVLAGGLLLPAAVFAAVNQAFVAVLGPRRGWMVSIVFAVLQAVSLGGLVPIDTAPPVLQALSGFLPVSLAVEAVADLRRVRHEVAASSEWKALSAILRSCLRSWAR